MLEPAASACAMQGQAEHCREAAVVNFPPSTRKALLRPCQELPVQASSHVLQQIHMMVTLVTVILQWSKIAWDRCLCLTAKMVMTHLDTMTGILLEPVPV